MTLGWFDDNVPRGYPTPVGAPQQVGATQTVQTPGLQPSAGGDFQQQFMAIMGGLPATPENLIAKERELAAAGIIVQRNAAGVAGKVKLPSGEIRDVIQSAGTGGGGSWQWGSGPGGPTGEGGKPLPGNQYYGQPGGGTLGSIGGGGVDYTKRQGALEDTPGFKFRFEQGMKAIQDSAAAKGTLLTGGVLKDLATFGQGLASTEYGNEWDRTMGLAQLGFNAASNQGAYGSAYGSTLTDLTTGAGNAQAAGTIGAGNAWSGALGNIGQQTIDAYGLYKYGPRQPQNGGARY